ncbi:MAG: O-antigen ligase family protein [Ilumatobacteraceae bacterium]
MSRWPLSVLTAYLLWSFASVMWSVAPDATAIRCVITTGVSALGVWYALCLRFKEQLTSMFLATAALTLWSLALILLQPHTHQIYPPPQYPQWHTAVFGVFGNPNSLGPIAALSALSALGMWVAFPTWKVRFAALTVAPIGLILTLWSQCMTAIAGLALAVLAAGIIFGLPAVRKFPGWLVATSLVVAVVASWNIFFHNIARIAPDLGATVTLSSRRIIWQDVRGIIALRPWRGYGFFAFWDNETFTAATYQHLGSAYGSAHNSVLEVALGLGRIGLVFYIGMALFMAIGTARAIWAEVNLATVAWVLVALFLIVQNSMESFVLWHSYLWALFVAATLMPKRLQDYRDSDGNSRAIGSSATHPEDFADDFEVHESVPALAETPT